MSKDIGSGATGAIGDDGRMQRFVPVEALFKGWHFDGQIIILCVNCYTNFKIEREAVSGGTTIVGGNALLSSKPVPLEADFVLL